MEANNIETSNSAAEIKGIHCDTLPCGLRIITAPSATGVAYCGLAINAGTRDEWEEENGLAHFCEHLSFKGTHRRRSWHILNRMEGVGGDLNAYTGKEETIYYSAFLKEHFERAIDLLTDIVLGSTYPQAEMEKEVEVVIDEIESYKDSPSDLIFDDFENLVFNGHSLGRNILGEAERLRQFKSEDVKAFARRYYQPRNMILFVYGQISHEKVRQQIEKALKRVSDSLGEKDPLKTLLSTQGHCVPFTDLEIGRKALPPYIPQKVILKKETHQAHVMIGTRCYSATDPRHIRLYLLNNILGGPGMNSRLNLSLRERNGLVYSAESSMATYTDTGVWCIYFGCDPKDINRCTKLVQKELQKLIEKPLSPKALETAKKQIKGQIGISYDNFESVAQALGKTFLHYNYVRDIEKLFSKIDGLTAEQLQQTATEIFCPENLTTLIYK